MKASQLTAFEERAHAVDEQLTPMTVSIGGTDYVASGTHAGHKHVRLIEGGEVQNRDVHFTIRKSYLPDGVPLHTLVMIAGQEYQIRKIWGQDEVDPVWSFRAEQWLE